MEDIHFHVMLLFFHFLTKTFLCLNLTINEYILFYVPRYFILILGYIINEQEDGLRGFLLCREIVITLNV